MPSCTPLLTGAVAPIVAKTARSTLLPRITLPRLSEKGSRALRVRAPMAKPLTKTSPDPRSDARGASFQCSHGLFRQSQKDNSPKFEQHAYTSLVVVGTKVKEDPYVRGQQRTRSTPL